MTVSQAGCADDEARNAFEPDMKLITFSGAQNTRIGHRIGSHTAACSYQTYVHIRAQAGRKREKTVYESKSTSIAEVTVMIQGAHDRLTVACASDREQIIVCRN